MSLLVHSKVAANSTQSDFERLCERCCWPTLNQGQQIWALLYPEEAMRDGYWQPGRKMSYMPRHLSVFRDASGSIACDGDFSRLKIAANEIYLALNGEKAELPRPSAAFCQQYALTRRQENMRAEGIESELVQESTGEWCLDVVVPGTEQSMEASLS